MKFAFNKTEMRHKGDCGHCPFLSYNRMETDFYCNLFEKDLPPRSMEEDCPLEEVHDIP